MSRDNCKYLPNKPSRTGYVSLTRSGKYYLAHRYYYELAKGQIEEGLVIDHLCGNRACVNVDHLEQVTQRENVRRAKTNVVSQNMAKTHCKRGHLFGEQAEFSKSRGWRRCRTCHANRERLKRRGIVYA